jgi:putative transposase
MLRVFRGSADPGEEASNDAALRMHGKAHRFRLTDEFNVDERRILRPVAPKEAEISISMDGKGAWRDNVFVERPWRSIK